MTFYIILLLYTLFRKRDLLRRHTHLITPKHPETPKNTKKIQKHAFSPSSRPLPLDDGVRLLQEVHVRPRHLPEDRPLAVELVGRERLRGCRSKGVPISRSQRRGLLRAQQCTAILIYTPMYHTHFSLYIRHEVKMSSRCPR